MASARPALDPAAIVALLEIRQLGSSAAAQAANTRTIASHMANASKIHASRPLITSALEAIAATMDRLALQFEDLDRVAIAEANDIVR